MTKMNGARQTVLLIFFLALTQTLTAQEQDSLEYKLNKSRFFLSPTFSIDQRDAVNDQQLIRLINNQDFLQYSIDINIGYFIKDDFSTGVQFSYENTRHEIDFTADNKTTLEQEASNRFSIAPNIRNYYGNRIKVFNQTSLAFTYENGLRRVTVDDEVDKYETQTRGVALGIQPGIAFFIDRAVSLEASIQLLGLETQVQETVKNDIEESRVVTSNVNFSINVLSLQIGLGFYLNEFIGRKQRKTERRNNAN